MAGLGTTLANLSQHRKKWRKLVQAGNLSYEGLAGLTPGTGSSTRRLNETAGFGPNPGNLRMLSHAPESLADEPALVVVLHGCTQNAAGYGDGAGWIELADRHGFALLLPEQQRSNNPNTCFNWFVTHHTTRGQGEVQSIRSMIDHMVKEHGIDRRRIFVTGLSAGGAMAAAMLAAYPEVFAAGAVIAGLPYRAATDIPGAFQSMSQGNKMSAQQQGDLVRAASSHTGPWPKVSIWHGTSDTTVHPVNAAELLKQWTNLHGLPLAPTEQDRVAGHPHRVWRDAQGDVAIEEYAITGMGHGTPLATGEGDNRYGQAGPYLLETGISSSYHIARSWGLTDHVAQATVSHSRELAQHSAPEASQPSARIEGLADVSVGDAGSFNPRAVIEKALRSAGLMK